MNEMHAIVVRLHGAEAEIEPVGGTGCSHCSSGKGCGSGKLSQLFCSNKQRTFLVSNTVHAQVGDEVSVGLQDGVLLRHSIMMYLLPLVFMLGCAALAVGFAGGDRDASALLGAGGGLLLGFLLVKRLTRHAGTQAVIQSVVTLK